jgi:aryl-alcohol dehydrogenase-like predicted oxidoreductase
LNKSGSLDFIRHACSLGVRHFDTASIYGQGDSERLLGEALQAMRASVFLATKAGQRLTPRQQLMRPLKPLIRSLLRRRPRPTAGPAAVASPPAMASLVAAQRARGVDYCFEPGFLLSSLAASLRRLRTDHVEIFYLHSPPPQELANPALWRALDGARRSGQFGQLGVSCDDLATAEAALACTSVEVLQFEPDDGPRSDELLRRAADSGVRVYARLGARRQDGRDAALLRLIGAPAVEGVLMGTTRAEHLVDNLQAFAAAALIARGARP